MYFRIVLLSVEYHPQKVSAWMHTNDHAKQHLRSASSAQEERLQVPVAANMWHKQLDETQKVEENRKE